MNRRKRVWKPLAGSPQENAIIRELRQAIDEQQNQIAGLRSDVDRLLLLMNAATPRIAAIQGMRPAVESEADVGILDIGIGGTPLAGASYCGWIASGTAIDVDSHVRVNALRFYLDSPVSGAQYRLECWRLDGLTLAERVGTSDTRTITTQTSPEGHWAEIGGLHWNLVPGTRVGILVVRVSFGDAILTLFEGIEPEYVPGLGQVALDGGHIHTNATLAAGLALVTHVSRARMTLFTAAPVPPHSHEIIDVRELRDALGDEAHFAYQGDLAVYTGVQRLYNTSGKTRTITSVALGLGTAPTGLQVVADVNVDGATIFSTGARPQVAIGATLGTAVPTYPDWPAGSYLTIDIDQIGSTAPGSDLTAVVAYSIKEVQP